MADAKAQKSLSELINIWVQTVGICFAGAWGAYTFIYKEIVVPAGAPTNTSVSLEIRKDVNADTNAPKEMGLALSMSASATNPSTRTVDLFHSIWLIYGYRLKANDKLSKDAIEKVLNADTLRTVSRFTAGQEMVLIATGRLFDDRELEPSEKISRREVLYIPKGRFDVVEFVALIPTATNGEGMQLTWTFDKNDTCDITDVCNGDVMPIIYGPPEKSRGEPVLASDKLKNDRGVEIAVARVRIPLVVGN